MLGSFSGNSYGLKLSNDENTLYVTTSRGIQKVNVIDPSNPVAIAPNGLIVTTPGVPNYEISADETKMFKTTSTRGFEVIDITNPSSPIQIGFVDPATSYVDPLNSFIKEIAISSDENTAFIAYGADGFVIVDLTSKDGSGKYNNLKKVSLGLGLGFADGIAISSDENTAFISDANSSGINRLYIISISDLNAPTYISDVVVGGIARDVVLSSTDLNAYVATWESGLKVVDTSDTLNPQVIGAVNTAGKTIKLAISLDDTHVFIADWDGGLKIIDTAKALLGDSIPPIIYLSTGRYIYHEQGIGFSPPGATATDDIDGDITANIVITGTIDVNTLGPQQVQYAVTDSSGNTTTATLHVEVILGSETGHTVIDAASGIEIQDNEAVTESMGRTWSEAVDYCENLVLNSLDDWRLPNENDYNDIITRGYAHAFNGSLENYYGWKLGVGFTGAPYRSRYWTSFEDSSDNTKAFHISNGDGVFGLLTPKSQKMGTRCVRN